MRKYLKRLEAWKSNLGKFRIKEYVDGNGDSVFRIECGGYTGWFEVDDNGHAQNDYNSRYETRSEEKAGNRIKFIENERRKSKRTLV